jgi:glycosyltransferase involved in cell wall biosynthesis
VTDRQEGSVGHVRVLYLMTDEMSSKLVRGQLDYLSLQGFNVHAAAGCVRGTSPRGFDESASVARLPFVREPSLRHDLAALASTIGLIRRVRPDVVNASTPKASMIGLIAARLCGVPVRVWVIRGLRYETVKGWRGCLLRVLDRIAGRCATHVVANSNSVLSVAVRDGILRKGTGEVIRFGSGNGIDLSRFKPSEDRTPVRNEFGLSPDARVIGFVGRLTRDKGVEDLIEVFGAVSAAIPNSQLLIVGTFEVGDAPARSIQTRIDGDDCIIHVPWLDDPAMAYCAMDLLIFPSYREGLPNVPIESQACGVPVLAYASTGTTDALKQGVGGRLVPTGDRLGLAKEAGTLLADEKQLETLGANGRNWVAERFSQRLIWAEIADRYLEWADQYSSRQIKQPVPTYRWRRTSSPGFDGTFGRLNFGNALDRRRQ